MYLHCSDRGLDGWWLDQGYDCPFKSPWLGVLCLFQQQTNLIAGWNGPARILQVLQTLSLSLSLWKALSFYPHINMTRLLSSYKLFALTSLEKWYRTGGNRTRFDPHLTWNTCICYSHSLLPLLQDWQLQVFGGRVFSNSARFVKKMLFPIPFRMGQTRKAICSELPLNSQLQLAPLKE